LIQMSQLSDNQINSSQPYREKENPKKNLIFSILRIGISLSALVIVFYLFRSKWQDVASILIKTQWEMFLIAYSFYVISFCIVTVRLKLVLNVQRLNLSFKSLFALGMIGLFFNNLLPSSLGGGCC